MIIMIFVDNFVDSYCKKIFFGKNSRGILWILLSIAVKIAVSKTIKHKPRRMKFMSRKGENIYKRKDGRWEGRYIKCYLADGKAKYGYCYGKTYREVKEKVAITRQSLYESKHQKDTGKCQILSVFCDEWLQLKRCKVKISTYTKYDTIIEKHIKPGLGAYMTERLNEMLVERFTNDLIHKHLLSPKTVKDILTVLRSILTYVEKCNSHIRHIEITYPKTEKKEMRVLTRNEQEKFIQYLMKDTDYCKFGTLLALLTGLRLGEICALQWKHVSITEGMIYIKATMQRVKNTERNGNEKTQIIISEPKSSMSVREIPLTPLALELCKKFAGDPDAYILTDTPDKYVEPRILQYRMKSYAEKCGFSDVHFHTLRHSFATRCVEVGFELKSLSEIMGHASPKITLERYIHSSLELKRENMMKLTAIGY